MSGPDDDPTGSDLFAGHSDVDAVQCLLADLHHALPGIVARFRYLADLDGGLGAGGTMLFGGSATFSAWSEARSSFVHGNFVATVLLCQSLAENLLAGFLNAGLMAGDLAPRIAFRDTLTRCLNRNLISIDEQRELERLMALRNPLSHFRNIDDGQNLDRRAMNTGLHAEELLRRDAWFAIGVAAKLLAKPQFRLG